jgi:hypothetical protein
MKMIGTPARTPEECIACLSRWQRSYAQALRNAAVRAVPGFDERLKWGHLVYSVNGPTLLISAEPTLVLFGFFAASC